MSDVILSEEVFSYDAAGNVTAAPGSSFVYDVSNRLTSFNGSAVSYDLDGNMLSNGSLSCTYDSLDRLISAGGHTYTYNAEDVRIRNLCNTEDTTYTYDTNCRLSKLLMKTTNGVVTKYVYGRGLIGEEVDNNPCLNVYHFDVRGSTVAITDMSGAITDTFSYDTYGKLTARTGTSSIIFGYNGKDGVVTDNNGLIYMRARYYSPVMKRFINADIIPGHISNAVTLNRFAFANGNPISLIDPFGLSAERTASNNALFNGLEGLYNIAFAYYKDQYWGFISDKTISSKANQAVMHYIMYPRFYASGYAKKQAWNIITGTPDKKFLAHMENYTEYAYLQDSNTKLYDIDSGQEIDFVHLIATLAANSFNAPTVGNLNTKLDSYTGWAGDLITLANDAQKHHSDYPEGNITQYVEECLRGEVDSSFPLSDLVADIDAIGISRYMLDAPIHTAFHNYYTDDYENRYTIFIETTFDGDVNNIISTASDYLDQNKLLTIAFMKMFNANYDKNIIQDVSTGFYNFLIAQK